MNKNPFQKIEPPFHTTLSKTISEIESHGKNFHLCMKQGIYNHSRVSGDAQNHLNTLRHNMH